MDRAQQKKRRPRPGEHVVDRRRFDPIKLVLRGTYEGDQAQLLYREQNRATTIRREVGPKQVRVDDVADFDAEVHVHDGTSWRFWDAGWLEDVTETEVRYLDEDDSAKRKRRRDRRPREEIVTVVAEGMQSVADRLVLAGRWQRVHVMARVRPRRPSIPSPTVRELYAKSGDRRVRWAHRPLRAEPAKSRVLTRKRARRLARLLRRRRERRASRSMG